MARRPPKLPDTLAGRRPFPETSWSAIHEAQDADQLRRRELLEELTSRYWGPVFQVVLRTWTRDVEEAKDLTQSFFVRFLEKDFLDSVDADRGRFRSFLRAALRNFLINERRSETARKRRPEEGLVSLDARGEAGAPVGEDPTRTIFDREWKKMLIETSVARLRDEATGTKAVFAELLVEYDLKAVEGERPTYAELAERFGIPQTQVTNGLRWARQRFGQLLEIELRLRTISDEDFRAEARQFGLEVDG